MQLDELLDNFDRYPFTNNPEKDIDARIIKDDGVTSMEMLVGAKMFSNELRAVIRSNSSDKRHPDIAILQDSDHLHFLVAQTTDGTKLPSVLKGKWRNPQIAQEHYSKYIADIKEMINHDSD